MNPFSNTPRNGLIQTCCLLMMTAAALRAGAPEPALPEVRLPLMKTAPVIDGKVDEQEWAGAARMEGFGRDGKLSPQEGSFWIGSDGKELFIAVVSETPPGGKLMQRVTPASHNGNARTWLDDSVELVLDPLHEGPADRRKIFHANFNAKGAINDTAYLPSGGAEAWRGHWRIASTIQGDRWHFEAAIPLSDLGVTADDLKRPFGARIVRNWMQLADRNHPQTDWTSGGGAFLNTETLPLVTWDERAPVVQMQRLHTEGKQDFNIRLSIRNPHPEPMEVRVEMSAKPENSAPSQMTKTVTVAPNGLETVDFMANSSKEDVRGLVKVTSADGKAVYYLREFVRHTDRPEQIWVLDSEPEKKIDFKFAYYPYYDTIETLLSINGLEEKGKVTGARLTLRNKESGAEIAATPLPPFKDATARMDWKIPNLPQGKYELTVELQGMAVKPPAGEFVRNVMPWERNSLGKSEAIADPFKPIKVAGKVVEVIQRKVILNNLGLWDQVESVGKPLLKGPMRLEVKAGGKTYAAEAKELVFKESKPARMETESTWSAGPIGGKTASRWDYDGMMRWELEIDPGAGTIDAMTLTIPLDNELMPLFHACTDGIRFNVAGATPKGEGKVWDGSKAARNSLIGTYVPYIWAGAEERGLSVFGDNDRGWVWGDKVSCQELVRDGDTLELRLNLIAAPTKLDAARKIVIGFQATPSKPMPPGWRTWTGGCGKVPGSEQTIGFLGCCSQWGALTPYEDIYPVNEDFTIYDKFAETRKTGEIDKAFLQKWLTTYPRAENINEKSTAKNLTYGFNVVAGRPTAILAYTNARGVRFDTPSGRTFLNEWNRDLFPTRNWPVGAGASYGLDPGESYRDFAMWYQKRMLDSFVDDIYWDDTYLAANMNTVCTDAYILPDGSTQPSCGLFNMRELIRRTAVFAKEQNKRIYNMAHMTNAAIAPILSFCGMQFDWEDRAGDSDFQDRFSRDYIRAESIGRQHGNVTFTLTLLNGADPAAEKTKWALRTMAGVALTHEVKPFGATGYDVYWANFKCLLDFGYGRPEVKVFNYWDKDYPVKVEGIESSGLAVSKPGSAIIIVCDYGQGGEVTVKPDGAILGVGQKFTAKDAESGQALPVGTDGSIKFPLKKHDFKVLALDASK